MGRPRRTSTTTAGSGLAVEYVRNRRPATTDAAHAGRWSRWAPPAAGSSAGPATGAGDVNPFRTRSG